MPGYARRGEDGLTDLQRAFVAEYIARMPNPNGRECVVAAGYKCKSQTAQTTEAYRLLATPAIKAAIEKQRAKLAKKHEITHDRVLAEYAKIAFANIADYLEFDADGVTLRTSSDLPREVLAAVESVAETLTKEGVAVRLKLHSKLAALDSICKMLGLNAPEKQELTGKGGVPLFPDLDLSGYTDEELELLRKIHEAANARRSEAGAGEAAPL